MTEYVVVHFFEPLPPGAEFPRPDPPFHVTISGNFELDAAADEVAAIVKSVAELAAPIDVVTSQRALFGPDRDIPVRLVEPVGPVRELHTWLADALEAGGATFVTPFIRAEYKPHVTSRTEGEFVIERPQPMSSMTLLTLENAASPRVVATFPLGAL